MYSALNEETQENFDLVKAAILKHFAITPDTYRKRYQLVNKKPEENWIDLGQRKLLLIEKWTKHCDSRQHVIDLFNMEDTINLMPDTIRTWVRDHKPKSTREATELADNYLSNRQWESDRLKRSMTRPSFRPQPPHSSNPDGKSKPTSTRKPESADTTKPWTLPKYDPSLGPRCFHCNQYGHLANACPKKEIAIHLAIGSRPLITCAGRIGDHDVHNMLVDPGASMTIVNSKWIPPSTLKNKFLTFTGGSLSLPLADTTLTAHGDTVQLEVRVQDDLMYDALLGLDMPFNQKIGDTFRNQEKVMAVHTRKQTEQHQASLQSFADLDAASEATLLPAEAANHSDVDTADDQPDGALQHLPDFAEDLFSTSRTTTKMTRSENRDARSMFASTGDILHPLDGEATALQLAQESDPSLRTLRDQVKKPGTTFVMMDGLLHRQWQPDDTDEVIYQLILPAAY